MVVLTGLLNPLSEKMRGYLFKRKKRKKESDLFADGMNGARFTNKILPGRWRF